MKILIAEDTPLIQFLHSELMKIWDFDCDVASNGQEAVALAQANKGQYDLCLMDIEMPIMNGIEAAKIIRKTVNYFPIMALTSNDGYKAQSYEVGMDSFSLKPCPANELLAKIRKLTVKAYKLITKPNGVDISEVMPVDKQHAEELRALAEKGLRKITFFDSPGRAVIVHENVMNKISHDFIVKGQLLTSFLNRDEDKPAMCHLFKESNYLMPQTLLFDEEYSDLLAEENTNLSQYSQLVLKAEKE